MNGNSFTDNLGYIHVVLMLLKVSDINGSYFFHVPSYIELQSPDIKTDFGFSISYQSKLNSLAVGAPHSDLNGKVYKCPMGEVTKKKKLECSEIVIDVDKLAGTYSRNQSVDQNFCLGASISATPEYIFTCAPLWSSYVIDGETPKFGTLGTCFVSNDTYASRYNGLVEQYMEKSTPTMPKIVDLYGGVGWGTLYDPNNDLILIAKPSLMSSISVMRANDPMKPTSAVDLGNKFIQYYNLGQSFAVGVFFNNHKLLYAFSMTLKSRLLGAVAFLYYDETMKILEDKNQPVIIVDSITNSMYGTSLHGADLNGDSFTELLVGAPAQTNDLGVYEHGAVFFYVGGGQPITKDSSNLCVFGTKDGARFGTAISSIDIDGDSIAEIFISAPYEESGVGAVYILSGHEVKRLLSNSRSKLMIKVSEFNDLQRITNVPYTSFGFSILPVPDFDGNGATALAIGSPNNGTVILYRSIPFINVTISASRVGKESVKEDDMNFTVTVSVNVTFPPKPLYLSGKLFVSTNIIGDPARIVNGKYEIDITKKQTLYTKEVLVMLDNEDPGNYKFSAKVESDSKHINETDFDKSLFRIPNYSVTETVLDIARRCKEIVCVPRFSMHFEWSGSTDGSYVLGSSSIEHMNVVVRNDGSTTFESCARIKVTGVKKFSILGCIQVSEEWYKCDLINIERHGERAISIDLDMSIVTNRENRLNVEVFLYNSCTNTKATVNQTKEISFVLNTTDISIDYLYYDRNVTLGEIEDVNSSPFITTREFFMIANNGTVTWKSIHAVVTFEMRSFIKNYSLLAPETSECTEGASGELIVFNCTLDLEPKSIFKISAITNLVKEKMMENFDNGILRIISNYSLYLEPTSEILKKQLTSTLYYQADAGIGNNKYVIIAIAVIAAIMVLIVVIFILYKLNFFERKDKAKLAELKEDIRKKSVRRPHPDDGTSNENENQAEIQVYEDAISLQLRNYRDRNDSRASLI